MSRKDTSKTPHWLRANFLIRLLATYRCQLLLSDTSNTDFGFHQLQRQPRIVQKQAIPHLKCLIVGFLNPEDFGRGIPIGLPRPLFMINRTFQKKRAWQAHDAAMLWSSSRNFLPSIRAFKMRYCMSLYHFYFSSKLQTDRKRKRIQK